MISKLESAKKSFHLFVAPVHPHRELSDLEPHMDHSHLEIADPASDLADVVFQIRNIGLNAREDLKDELVRWFGHGLSYR
jgi:hypothetical protein